MLLKELVVEDELNDVFDDELRLLEEESSELLEVDCEDSSWGPDELLEEYTMPS